jgi:hypothetical protein
MSGYGQRDEEGWPARVAMPRAPRLVVPGATVHVVARCNNREFQLTTPEDFSVVLRKLQLMLASYALTLYAYTLMSGHWYRTSFSRGPEQGGVHAGHATRARCGAQAEPSSSAGAARASVLR